MQVTPSSLRDIYTGYNSAFTTGMGMAPVTWPRIATKVPTSSIKTKMPWLKDVPGLRRWLGDRVVHGLEAASYEIENLEYEDTFGLKLREIESDQFGVFAPRMQMMGEQYAAWPDQTIWPALLAGFDTECSDGQYFFDSDHVVLDKDGAQTSVSNVQAGSSTPWYLLVTKRAVKPLVWTARKEEPFKQLTPQELVDRNKVIEYGCYIDAAVGYGFWQFAFGSKADLTADNYAAARAAMMSFYGDHGKALGLVPDLLVVPPTLEGKARKVVVNDTLSTGGANEWAGTAELLVTPWLA